MPRNGVYSKADATQKLIGAVARLSKNHLQPAVNLMYDALGMLRELSGKPLDGKRAEEPAYLAARLGAADGTNRKAVINELMGQAIGEIRVENWQQAAWHITDAAFLVDRIAESQNKVLQRVSTPVESEAHE